MAEIWGAAILGTVAVGSAVAQNRAAGNAARAQGRASDAAINEQGRQFDTLLSLTSNQRQIGNQALNALGGIYGYSPAPGFSNDEYAIGGGNQLRSQQPVMVGGVEMPPGTTTKDLGKGWFEVWFDGQRVGTLRPGGPSGRFINDTGADLNSLWGQWEQGQMATNSANAPGGGGNQLAAPDYSEFYRSPDYQFRMNEGLNAVQNSAAAQGGLYSGNALRGIQDYGQGLAAGEFGNYVNRQLAIAGMGQAATTQAGNAAMTTGANIGNMLLNQGNARASGIINQSNAITGGINDLASLYGMYRGGYFGSGSPYAGGWANQASAAGVS
jgi:hypothetical protein